jgi:hypothetical protein
LAKKKKEKPRREFTRRQRSRWEQQKRRQRLIFGAAILIAVAVLSVIGVGVYQGWYVKDYKPLHETVIEVNETKFDMDYYIKVVKFYAQDMSTDYIPYVASYVVDIIERNELIRQEAEALGITVSDDAVDERLANNGLPPNDEYRDIARATLLMEKMRDEYFDGQLPLTAEQRHVMAMFLESEAQADDITARLEAGEDFGELAAEYSVDDTTKGAEGDLGWCPAGVLPLLVDSEVLEENAFSLEVGALSPPVYEATKSKKVCYWLIKVMGVDDSVEPVEASVWAILVGSEAEANDIAARLEAGEDAAELAAEHSLYPASQDSGGELVVHPSEVTAPFDDYVFGEGVPLDTLSAPIRDDTVSSNGGYWLIEVTESQADRVIDDEIRGELNNNALNEWIAAIMADPENVLVSHLDEEKTNWAVSYIIGG